MPVEPDPESRFDRALAVLSLVGELAGDADRACISGEALSLVLWLVTDELRALRPELVG